MFARKLLGIVITSERVSIASLTMSLRSAGTCDLWTAPLPIGCIDEVTGSLKLTDVLRGVLRKAPVILGLSCPTSRASLVLPHQMFCSESWILREEADGIRSETIVAEAQRRIPLGCTEIQRGVHWRAHAVKGHAPAAMVVAARCSSIEGYIATTGDCGAQLDSITSPATARFNLLCLVRPESMHTRVMCVTARPSVVEFEVWIGGVLVWERRAGREALVASSITSVFKEADSHATIRTGANIQTFDCIAAFGDRHGSAAGLGFESLHELCRITGTEMVYPMEVVSGPEIAHATICWADAVGAMAPYCQQWGVAAFATKVLPL